MPISDKDKLLQWAKSQSTAERPKVSSASELMSWAKQQTKVRRETQKTAISRVSSGALPLSPIAVKTAQKSAQNAQSETLSSLQQKKSSADAKKASASAHIQALSAGGWLPGSTMAQQLQTAYAERDSAARESSAIQERMDIKSAQANADRIANLKTQDELKAAQQKSGMTAAHANARAQAMLANPASANMQ